MILGLEKKEVYVSGVQNSYNFSIGDEAMIISILRDKLYSNPKRTLIQEYVSNARDAHREFGKENVPVEITLPNRFDRFLKIKDFGPGISPERAKDVFCGYGLSTKRSSDNQTGGFGIGAKSAWSYVDSFNIETIVDKKKYYYSCYIDATNKGKMDLLQTENVEEENGTCIIIPVKEQDMYQFHNLVGELFKYWSVKPTITGGSITFEKFEIINSGKLEVEYIRTDTVLDDEFLLKDVEISEKIEVDYVVHNEMKKFILIDELRYPINTEKMNITDGSVIKYLDQICFKFNTGLLSINPNREDIIYDEKTINILNSSISQLIASIRKEIQDKVDEAKSLNEAFKIVRSFDKTYPIKSIYDGIHWKTYALNKSYVTIHSSKYHCIKYFGTNGRLSKSTDGTATISFDGEIYLNDEFRESPNRLKLRHLIFEKKLPCVYVIQPKYLETDFSLEKDVLDSELIKDIEYSKLSTTPRITIKTADRVKGKAKVYYYTGGSSDWCQDDLNYIEDEGVYVALEFGKPVKYANTTLYKIKQLSNETIYGIPKRYIEKFKASENFIELSDWIKDWHETFTLPEEDLKKDLKSRTFSLANDFNSGDLSAIKEVLDNLYDKDFFSELLSLISKIKKDYSYNYSPKITNYIDVCKQFNLTPKLQNDNLTGIDEEYERLIYLSTKYTAWYNPQYSISGGYGSPPNERTIANTNTLNGLYLLHSLQQETH